MTDLKRYIVTLHDHNDLQSFYDDMETPGGDLYIPDRMVVVEARRPKSRNTIYSLTQSEAELIRQDPRVADVITEDFLVMSRRPMYTQTSSDWDKAFVNNANHDNWGLLRCVEGSQRSNWGEDGTTNQSGTITVNTTGKNVDVVIVDGHIDPAHPEFAVNSDGTGGTRVNQYNWLQHTNAITGGANGTYQYTPYIDGSDANRTADNNHGVHVGGTVSGNTQGWARSSNVYNISPYSTNPNAGVPSLMYDYIREFHAAKAINPATGRKNPTILNCSFGSFLTFNEGLFGPVTRIVYRGTDTGVIAGNATVSDMTSRGIYTTDLTPTVPYYTTSDLADIQDLINDGIVIVAAAGNSSFYQCNSTDQDWNNYFYATYDGIEYIWYYHRGTAPAALDDVLSVGAVGNTVNETKASFSNNGPGVDIYAPGRAIQSSLHSGGVSDPRNAAYQLGMYQGTSMASPQVCGVLACALEVYPSMHQARAREYILGTAKQGQMTDTGGSYTDLTSLNGSDNKYLFFKQERESTGGIFPKKDSFSRPPSGSVFPRFRYR